MNNYPKKDIPNEDFLFLRIHKTNIDPNVEDKRNNIRPVAFDPKPKETDGLSVNWSKYSDAPTTKYEVVERGKAPENYGVVSLNVGRVREISLLVVEHDPLPNQQDPITDNQAHSLILNIPPRKPSDNEVRVKLRERSNWVLELGE